MLHLDEMAPLDGLSDTLRSGRRGLAKVDLESVGTAAASAARTILPDAWVRPRPRRWPFVVGLLLFGSLIGILVLFRQPILDLSVGEATARKRATGVPPEPVVDGVEPNPDVAELIPTIIR